MNKEKAGKAGWESVQGGIFIPMFLILFALKVGQFGLAADLSWFWVTLPLWGLLGIVLLVIGVALFMIAVAGVIHGLCLGWARHRAKRARKARDDE